MTDTASLYAAWIAAEKAFQDALEARYGKRAGDMRYRYDLPPGIAALGAAFVAAGEAYWKAMGRA